MKKTGFAKCAPPVLAGCMMAAGQSAFGSISIPTVFVGNPNNAADTVGHLLGAVNYSFNIGTTEVTSTQYTAFLNAVAQTDPNATYTSLMADVSVGGSGIVRTGASGSYIYNVTTGHENDPITEVSLFDAMRFTNWLANGQPNGAQGALTTEKGTYDLQDATANTTPTRGAKSTWAIASENEWYKAAYYSPTLNGGAGGYWLYPTQSNTITTNQANYNLQHATAVGSYAFPSYYGTYDQGGNAQEWTDDIGPYGQFTMGGAFTDQNAYGGPVDLLSSTTVGLLFPQEEPSTIGFRVSNTAVPEPAVMAFLGLGFVGLLGRRRSVTR